MTFYHAAYFSWGLRASGVQDGWKQWELKGVEGRELPRAFSWPAMTVSVARSHLESRPFAARAARYEAKRHSKGIDSQDLSLKKEPLQNDSTDAPALIYSSLGPCPAASFALDRLYLVAGKT